jgi:DNA repair protein RadC
MSRIHEMIPSQRPRERLLGYGASALSDAELIALLLRVGRQGRGVVSEAHLLLSEVGGLAELGRMDSRELMRRPGLGPAKVAALLAAFELGRRSAGVELRTAERLDRPEVAGAFLARRVMGERHEVFGVVALDARHRYLSLRFLTRGTRNQAPVDPADVFRSALLDHAAGVLAFHNHPSGDLEPSVDDLALTRRLSRAGESVGVALLDHLIVAGARWVSLRTARPELFTSTSM